MDEIRGSRVEQVLDNEWTSKTKKISRAPLHKAWPLARNCSDSKIEELLLEGYNIKRGKWTKKEDRRLRKNWNRIVRCHPQFADPFLAFGVKHRPKHLEEKGLYVIPKVKHMRDVRRNYAMFGLLFRMAYGLDDRLLCDIYGRCKRLFAFSLFQYNGSKDVPEEVRDAATEALFEDNGSIEQVSYRFDISPNLVKEFKRNPIRFKSHRFTPEDDFALKTAIQFQFPTEDVCKIPTYKIDWAKVEKDMAKYGYGLRSQQLARRWRYINPKLVGVKKTALDRVACNGQDSNMREQHT